MKLKLVAVAVTTLLAAGVTNAAEIYNKDGNKLDLYGKMQGLHYFSSDKGERGDNSYARLGVKGETQITDQLTGFGQWEYNMQANRDEKSESQSWTRLGFAGLKYGDYGSFNYGRNYGVVYDALGFTDMLPEFGGDTANSDNYMVGRSGGLATYRNQDFFGLVTGLNIALQYQGKNEGDGRASTKANGDGYGASIDYEDIAGSGIGAVIAGSSSDRTNAQSDSAIGGGDKASAWATALKYDANQIYLSAMYNETRNLAPIPGGYANKTQGYELVAQYQFENGLRPSIGYVQSKAKDVENGIGDVDLVKYFEIGATYYFNKNMYTYVDYMINQIDDNNKLGVSSDDIVAVALTYRF